MHKSSLSLDKRDALGPVGRIVYVCNLEGVLTSPECFPAVQVVKAGEAESTSCEGASGGQGCMEEPELEIWHGIWLRV